MSLETATAQERVAPPVREKGTSHVVRPLLDMLLRRGWDGPIRKHWRQYTHCSQTAFVFAAPEDIFAWRNDKGTEETKFPEPTDSIARLRKEAVGRNAEDPFLNPFYDLLGLHLIVCPFRATSHLIGILDQQTPPQLGRSPA